MSYIVKPPCDEAVIQSAPVHDDSKELKRTTRAELSTSAKSTGRWVLVATILGSSMAFIDGTVVNVALPVLQTELHATATDVQWVVEAYSLFLAALILVGGSLGDHFGRRRVFAIGIVLFTVASVLCGLAPNVTVLIFARAFQGVGGALLVPGSLAIISASFDSKQRGTAIGSWSGFPAITSAIGPVLGGVLVQYASWRWVFFINVPLAVIVLLVLFWRVPESRNEALAAQPQLDWWGALLATLGLGGMVFGLIQYVMGQKYLIPAEEQPTPQTVAVESAKAVVAEPKGFTSQEWGRIAAACILTLFALIFWAGFEQAGSSLNLFADRATRLTIFGFNYPSSWFQSVEPLFVIVFSAVFAWV